MGAFLPRIKENKLAGTDLSCNARLYRDASYRTVAVYFLDCADRTHTVTGTVNANLQTSPGSHHRNQSDKNSKRSCPIRHIRKTQ